MSEGSDVDPAEFGPASKFLANLDYYETVGKELVLHFEDQNEKRLVPGENFDRESVEPRDMGLLVKVRNLDAVYVEQVRVDGEPLEEIVEWTKGTQQYTVAERVDDANSDVGIFEATEVEIRG